MTASTIQHPSGVPLTAQVSWMRAKVAADQVRLRELMQRAAISPHVADRQIRIEKAILMSLERMACG